MGLGAWFREYMEVGQLRKDLAEWKSRALRAEEAWRDRQKEIMELSMDLRNEKSKVENIESMVIGQVLKLMQNVSKRFMGKYGISIQCPLQRDEHRRLHISNAIVAVNPTTIINAFAAMLHTDKETLLARLGESMDILQKVLDKEIPPTTFPDNFEDIGGRLYPDSHCGSCQHGK